jgi:hypothetical protein
MLDLFDSVTAVSTDINKILSWKRNEDPIGRCITIVYVLSEGENFETPILEFIETITAITIAASL